MKIAFDEHIPKDVAKALTVLAGDNGILRATIYSARRYAVPRAQSDVPWLEKFARSGGQVVISGDARMRGKLHEQRALSTAGFIVFFLARQWNQMKSHDKCAMLIRWWPIILEKMSGAKPGQFFEIPHSWTSIEMREVTPPAHLKMEQLVGRRRGIAGRKKAKELGELMLQ